MTKIALSLAFALTAAASVHADDITIDPTPFTSTLTRAEVMADLQQARRSGVNPWADEYNPLADFQSSKTRAQVTAEYLGERNAVAAFNGEDSGSVYLARREPAQSRETQLAAAEDLQDLE